MKIKMLRKKIPVLFLLVLLFSLASASALDIPVYTQWGNVNIHHPIRIDGAVSSTIVANITIRDPNNIVLVSSAPMTYVPATQEHNYTLEKSKTGTLGTYEYVITATGSGLNATSTFNFEITPSGQTGLLGFYFLAIVLGYGTMLLGIWKEDMTITMLGTFAMFFIGLYIMFFGLDIYKNFLTSGFAIITLGIAMYVTSRVAGEYLEILE